MLVLLLTCALVASVRPTPYPRVPAPGVASYVYDNGPVYTSAGVGQYAQQPARQSGVPVATYNYEQIYGGDIALAENRLAASRENNVLMSQRLEDLGQKIELVSNFRDAFRNSFIPGVDEILAGTESRIRDVQAQLKDLNVLFDEVRELKTQVNNIVEALQEIRATEVETESSLGRLENTDIDQDKQIGGLEAWGILRDDRLSEADTKVADNEATEADLVNRVTGLIDISNQEQAEVFTLTVNQEQPNVYQPFSTPFVGIPGVAVGITKFVASEDSDGEYQTAFYTAEEAVRLNVAVVPDANGVNVTLEDTSSNWFVDEVTIQLTAYYINNQEIGV